MGFQKTTTYSQKKKICFWTFLGCTFAFYTRLVGQFTPILPKNIKKMALGVNFSLFLPILVDLPPPGPPAAPPVPLWAQKMAPWTSQVVSPDNWLVVITFQGGSQISKNFPNKF